MNISNLDQLDHKWNDLKISEKLFCLAIDAQKINFQIPCFSKFTRALNVAIIFELIESKLIEVDDEMNIHFISATVYDRVHDFCMVFIRGIKQITRLKKFYHLLCCKQIGIQRIIRRDLVRKNIINVKKKSYLLYVKRRYSFQKTTTIPKIKAELAHILSEKNIQPENLLFIMLVSKLQLIQDKTIQGNIKLYLESIPQEKIPPEVHLTSQLIFTS